MKQTTQTPIGVKSNADFVPNWKCLVCEEKDKQIAKLEQQCQEWEEYAMSLLKQNAEQAMLMKIIAQFFNKKDE